MLEILRYNEAAQETIEKRLASRNQLDMGEISEKVSGILKKVRENRDEALIEFTEKFDNVKLGREQIKVSNTEIADAIEKIEPGLADAIRKACKNIFAFHEKQREKSWFDINDEGVLLGQLIRPLDTVGVYVPGGTAPLISSLLMSVIPARVAGVRRIIMATPPQKDGSVNPNILFAAKEAGVDEIYRIGGAQAIGALAFGTETVPAVEKICGPGNIYVATAKRMVFGYCGIDIIAGPSEIAVIADDTAVPSFIAADLLSQAEHDPLASSILITDSMLIAMETLSEIEKQVAALERKDIIIESLERYGMIIVVDRIKQAFDIANRIAPEHLELCVRNPFESLGLVKNAGAIFLGNYSSEPVGDYFAGPNHILPTGGTAKFFSPLNVLDFVKRSSVISYNKEALMKNGKDIIRLAECEELTAHANAIKVRLDYLPVHGEENMTLKKEIKKEDLKGDK